MNLLAHAPGVATDRLMGVRPEHIDLTPHSGWELKTYAVELLGAERLVHAHLGDETLTLRLDATLHAPAPGEVFHSTPKQDRLHWFDAHSRQRLDKA